MNGDGPPVRRCKSHCLPRSTSLPRHRPNRHLNPPPILSLIEIALGDRVSWLAAGQAENPFEFRVLDCREAALVCRSFTTDRAVAESFNRLRLFDGRGLVGQRPQDAVVHEVHLHFPLQSRAGEGPMFKAQVMEDRWDIYLFGNEVYLTCSWTGELIHVLECDFQPASVVIRRIHTKPQPIYIEEGILAAEMACLLVNHLSGIVCPFPIPTSVPKVDAALAHHGMSIYGRRALFGT
jgi:hypothetical protein